VSSPLAIGAVSAVLKNLLDIAPVEALQGKPVGIVAMGGSAHHFLGVDWQLRQVLGWFGALVAPTAVYLTGGDFKDGNLASESGLKDLAALCDTLVTSAATGFLNNFGSTTGVNTTAILVMGANNALPSTTNVFLQAPTIRRPFAKCVRYGIRNAETVTPSAGRESCPRHRFRSAVVP